MKRIIISVMLAVSAASFSNAQTGDEQTLFRLAQSFEQAGDVERAGQLYEQLQSAHSENGVYFDALRKNYTQRKKYDAAIELCRQRLRSGQVDVNVMTALGGLLSMAGHPAQADSVWGAVLSIAPHNPGVFRLVALEQIQLRLLEKAVATYRLGRQRTGDVYGFANELAGLHTAMMNYIDAASEFMLMLEQNENQLDYVESRLSLFTNRAEGLSAALSCARRYADEPKRSVVFMRLVSWLWMEAKRYDEAYVCIVKLENRIGSGGAELFMFAERAFREQEYASASKAYERSLEAGEGMPWAPQARFGYARCLEELSAHADSLNTEDAADGGASSIRLAGVIAAYEVLAKEYPRSEIHAQSLYRIGTLRAERVHDLNGALRVFDSITVIAPASPMLARVRIAMGDVYLRQGKLAEAITQYVAVGSSSQSGPQLQSDARYRMAEVRYFKTEFDSALVLLEPLTENVQADEANDALELRALILENRDANVDALRAYAQAEYLVRREKLSEALAAYGSIIIDFASASLIGDAMLRKANVEVALHRPTDALKTLQTFLTAFLNSTLRDKAQFRIGEIHELQLHDKDNAIQAYGEILAKYTNSLFTDEARRRIRVLRGDEL